MNNESVRKIKDPMGRMIFWITERERIRQARINGLPAPWTDNETLGSYRFCNVRRMDDKVSDWLLKNWYEPYYDHPNMLIACVLARQINRIDTLNAIGFPENWDAISLERKLQDMMDRGIKAFSAAYMITGTLGGSKPHQIVRKVVDPLYPLQGELLAGPNTRRMESLWKLLLQHAGMGTFIAGQVVADLRWAVGDDLIDWQDRYTWAPIGPGSRRGINRIQGKAINTPVPTGMWRHLFAEYIKTVSSELPEVAARLEAIDWQNTLCEFDKFERTLWGEGKPKQRYRGGA